MTATRRDESTRDLLHSRLRLRDCVRVWPERSGGQVWYHIEQTESGRFFRIGQAEYTFISLLDGETSLGEAVSLTARALGPDALTETQATTIALWLIDSGLARAGGANEESQPTLGTEKLNPFWLKVPLGNPDRMLTAASRWLGWVHSGPAVVMAMCLWVSAAISLVTHWKDFATATRSILAPDNWLWLTAAWLALKIIHELSHALACKRHGGSVRETGLIFVLLAPMAFVDVTSSIRFRSKWQRIQVAAGGMYAELTIAALALLLWPRVDSAAGQHLLHNLIVMASVSTILFNANPLMRFDGYFILSDLSGIPNLYQRGGEFLKRLAKAWLLGIPQPAIRERGLRASLIRVYGVAAFAWRMLICAGLLITASALFEGLGVLLAVAGLVAWFGRPLWRTGRLLVELRQLSPRLFVRTLAVSTVVLAFVAGTLLLTPWPGGRTAPGYVEFRDFTVVRAGSPGFVKRLHVLDGVLVEKGEPLIELANPELEAEVVDLQLSLEQSRLRREQHIENQDAVAAQVETENRNAIMKRLAEKQKQQDSLVVRAPQAGRVLVRGLTWKRGPWLAEGDEILLVGDESHKEFRASLSQEDVDALAGVDTENQLPIRIHARNPVAATVKRVTPRASSAPLHEALTASGGGRLAIRESASETGYELVEPRFTAEFALPADSVDRFPTGAIGEVRLQPRRFGSLGEGLYRSVSDWIDDRVADAFRDNRRS